MVFARTRRKDHAVPFSQRSLCRPCLGGSTLEVDGEVLQPLGVLAEE